MRACALLLPLAVGGLALASAAPPAAAQEDSLALRITPTVRVVQSVGPAVVNVYQKVVQEVELPWPYNALYGPQRSNSTSLGSGFIIDSDGYVLTNAHVVQAGREGILVKLSDGTTCPAKLQSVDADNDVALLKIVPPPGHELVPAPLGTSSDLMVGESVIAIGNPLGNENSVSTGVISSMFRDVRVHSAATGGHLSPAFKDFIQFDAPINPGNSGGPLLNAAGEVIGVNFAVSQNAQGIGFAIPIDRVRKSLIGRLLSPRLEREVATGLEIRGNGAGRDVELAEVTPGGPAADAGLQAGDRLLEVAHQPIHWEFDYNKALLDKRPGDRVPVVVQRDGHRVQADLLLAHDESPLLHISRALGLRVVDHPTYRGVFVEQVEAGGPGALLGLARGDLIDGVGERLVDSSLELYDAVKDLPAGRTVTLHVWRGSGASSGPLTVR